MIVDMVSYFFRICFFFVIVELLQCLQPNAAMVFFFLASRNLLGNLGGGSPCSV